MKRQIFVALLVVTNGGLFRHGRIQTEGWNLFDGSNHVDLEFVVCRINSRKLISRQLCHSWQIFFVLGRATHDWTGLEPWLNPHMTLNRHKTYCDSYDSNVPGWASVVCQSSHALHHKTTRYWKYTKSEHVWNITFPSGPFGSRCSSIVAQPCSLAKRL